MKRTIRITVRGSVMAYVGGKLWGNLGHRDDPATGERIEAFLAGEG